MRTKEWLIKTRKANTLTQRKLAELAGIATPTIAKIESGERFGSAETWAKIEAVLVTNEVKVSYASDEEIEDLKLDLEEYGPTKMCTVYYEIKEDHIFFTDYMIKEDLESLDLDELVKYHNKNSITVTLLEALDLFEAQNRI